MANIEWVLVADSAYARIFERRRGELALVHQLEHPESREQSQDLMGNRPHRNQHGMEKDLKGGEPQALRDDESVRFAKQLAELLQRSHAQNLFHSLVLVSDPRFLGMLRGELTKSVTQSVRESINKHAVRLKADEVSALLSSS